MVEFAGIGPGPFCGMLLSDLGADIVRIDRKTAAPTMGIRGTRHAVTERGRRSIAMDLKRPEAVDACLKLADRADAVFEGFRPGVMERLGLGPATMLARNPALVYGRITGWGQTGPYAAMAGHDINYIALSGALDAIGPADKPAVPLNLVGDLGGGALYLALGLLAGVLHARATGQGQIVDAAMSDGAASLMAMFYGFRSGGLWPGDRAENLLDGGAPFYDTYRCADGKWIAIGSVESQFFGVVLEKTGLTDFPIDAQLERSKWPLLRSRLETAFLSKTRDEWSQIFNGTDACFAAVMAMDEAPDDAHNRARNTFIEIDGVIQPGVAPRFSASPGAVQGPPPQTGANTSQALSDWGFSSAEIQALADTGAI